MYDRCMGGRTDVQQNRDGSRTCVRGKRYEAVLGQYVGNYGNDDCDGQTLMACVCKAVAVVTQIIWAGVLCGSGKRRVCSIHPSLELICCQPHQSANLLIV